jgi:CHRD domain-containing protein
MLKGNAPLGVGIPLFAMILGISQPVMAHEPFHARMVGAEEVPPVSTGAAGFLRGEMNDDQTEFTYSMIYFNLQGNGTPFFASLHLGQPGVTGGIVFFLCGGGGKPDCPPAGTLLKGSIGPGDVIGPAGQGISAGELRELLRDMSAGTTYINLHTLDFPDGEIRGQLK